MHRPRSGQKEPDPPRVASAKKMSSSWLRFESAGCMTPGSVRVITGQPGGALCLR
jgi:hypothetical protein